MTLPKPPVAAVRPHVVASPHGNREDPYYWLRDDSREDPEVLAYLNAENAYADALLAPAAALQERLYEEIIGRIQQDDASVPYLRNGYWYYSRYVAGGDYPVHARRKGSIDAPEELLLDVNQLAAGHGYFNVGDYAVSPDNRMLAWAEDAVGRRQYVIRVRDLATGELLPDRIEDVEPDIEWAADSHRLLYVAKDPVTLLGDKVRCHVLGEDAAADRLIYAQPDDSFYTSVGKTKDEQYLVIGSSSTVSSELQVARADDPELAFRVLVARERDHEYQAEHFQGRWILLTNWQARNFRLVEADAGTVHDRSTWRELVPHRPDALIEGFDVFRGFLAVEERSGGLRNLRIRTWDGAREFLVDSEEPAYTIVLAQNAVIDTDLVRYAYGSLATPGSVYDFNVTTGEKKLLKRDPVLGGYDPHDYVTEHLWAPARDGTQVPVSLVYRRGLVKDGRAPLLQYAYGAYGISSDPAFSIPMLPLLERGFVHAIAHVRGGQEMGRAWYDAGRLLAKPNTFTDFIDVTRYLVRQGHADPKRVFARGGSAGGLLVAAVANLAPREYRGIIALVPFVDAVTTMLDESIPLTTNEYDEWGDPREKASYDCMLAYSPYDNVVAQEYPALYVHTGLWDSQVQYYEPAKWVARLRALGTGSRPVLLRTNMEAGHGGKSGRFQRYREIAEQWAFLLQLADRPDDI